VLDNMPLKLNGKALGSRRGRISWQRKRSKLKPGASSWTELGWLVRIGLLRVFTEGNGDGGRAVVVKGPSA
jgi:hypothetical protein